VREAGATFGATAVQDSAAGTGCHALHKTVLLGAVAFFGLIGSLRHKNPSDLVTSK
jgi:hypothetical protein